MKRILLVSPFPPYIGGVSVSVQRLFEHLRREGYQVERFNTQVKNRKYNTRPAKFIRYLGLPVYLLFRKRFDVIHFHVSGIIPKLYVSLWKHLFSKKTKFIITVHGQIRNAFRSKLGYYSLKGFDRIILVKRGDKNKVPVALAPKTVEIPAFIPPVIEKEYKAAFPEGLESFLNRRSFKMLLNGFIIVNDQFNDLYGFRDAIELLGSLKDSGRNADLILIVLGSTMSRESGTYLKSLKTLVKSKNLEKNVHWIEGATMELWPLLRKVNVLLRPTKTDGDALSVRESLFLNIPVITSNVVPRPAGSLVYKLNSSEDLLNKTISLIDNYENYVNRIDNGMNINFAYKIIEQYESN